MAPSFTEGTLVTLLSTAERTEGEGKGERFEAKGQCAQLLDLAADSKWLAITLGGVRCKVEASGMRFATADDVSEFDFVIGPRSNEAVLAREMIVELVRKGFCLSHKITPEASVSQMQQAAAELKYSRVPAEFEPFYLGRDSREKTALVDFDSPEVPAGVLTSPLADCDDRMASLCAALSPALEEELGLRIASRTNLLLRQTFADDAEEALFLPPGTPAEAEREAFLSLMKRKRVCVMQFVGPLEGHLTLTPKGADAEEADDIRIETSLGLLVVFLTERFAYSYTCAEGASLALQTWFLGQRPEFQMGEIGGDLELLAGSGAQGPPQPKGDTVAVTGIATCLGGDSSDYLKYWLAVNKAGADSFIEIPLSRWDKDVYCIYDDMNAAMQVGKAYIRHQGYVDGIELFDSKLFGISPAEAASMDPNQRKCLEVVYEAMAMDGYTIAQLSRSPAHVGCFIGISGSEWGQVPHLADNIGCGSAEAIISNRCNFSLNLKGSSQTINTACSASLVAMHTGKLHLKYKDFDPLEGVVTGGLNLAYSPGPFIGCCAGGMLSFKGRSFTFDVSGDGYGRGEGASMVFMKNMDFSPDVFALVAGSQSNQDGRSASITAPNGPSQEKCIKAAFKEAALKPLEVDCFECHGTGTALGDPIEVGAFRRIYNSVTRSHCLLVTTSKTNLGHSEGGAGMAGFVKCCLQVARAEASPNLHLRERNPHLDLEGFPAQLISEPLICNYDSAYCGVSSFGFGGTNAHAMAYGRNVTTSRSMARQGQNYYRGQMRAKLAAAPPPDIMMLSDDPEEWETSGMPVSEDKIGKVFQVEITDTGKAIWREVVSVPPAIMGERFYLSGTFNEWRMDRMEADASVPGLHIAELTVGEMGQELFHIVANEDPGLVYYPRDTPACLSKVEPVAGPEMVDVKEECSWAIVAPPGTRFNVEFHCSRHSRSVSWLRKEGLAIDGP